MVSDSFEATVLGLLVLLAYLINTYVDPEKQFLWTGIALFAVEFGLQLVVILLCIFTLKIPYDQIHLTKNNEKLQFEDEPLIGVTKKESFGAKFVSRAKAFFTNKIAMHTLLIGALINTAYTLFEVPASLIEAAEGFNVLPPDQQNAGNLCGNQVTNIITQTAILDAMYFCSTILYGQFLVDCTLQKFYKYVYPVFAVLLSLSMVAVFLKNYFKIDVIVFILVSLAQILCYYSGFVRTLASLC